MQQLHELGVLMRSRYIDTYSMITANYTRQDVYVRSTDYDRTLISAQSLLQGLFPPGTGPIAQDGQPGLTIDDLQPVPIHTGGFLRLFASLACEVRRE
jgi:lysosomal acid phosphatase